MTQAHPTMVVPATADSLLEQADGLALLAFGAFSEAGAAQSMAGPRHLAFLTPDALDLDLNDPLQRHFANYELEAKIGQGGMGVVYRARQASLDREVALKLLAAGPWASTDFIERFKREAQSAARMQHPNIVPIFEIGSQDGLHFFSMRLVRGPSLAQVLAEHGAMAPKPAAVLVRTLAEALDYAHRLGVLHLDLKPGNVLIDEHGEPQVADFGLSRRLDQTVQADSDEVSGTPSYMAPEQATARANRFSQATDIYGLGTILYELLTARPPFLAATAQETLQLVVSGAPEAPRALDRRIPADLEAICLKCLAKEPGERYRSARELSEELARFVDGRAVLVRPLNTAQRIARWARREPRVAFVAAFAITALIVGLFGTTTQWRRAEAGTNAVRELLWSQRLDGAMRALDERNPSAALPLLVTNLSEKEAAGASAAATRDRHRIGAVLAASPRLVAMHHVAARVTAVAIAPGGATVALGTSEPDKENPLASVVRLVDTETGQDRWRRPLAGLSHFMTHSNPPADELNFSSDGSRLVVHNNAKPSGMDMVLLDVATGDPILPPESAFADFRDASFSADGRFVLLRDNSRNWQAFRIDGWKALGAPRALGDKFAMLAPGGRYAVMVTRDFAMPQLYAVPALEPVWEATLPAAISAWSFDPGGTLLALGLVNGQVVILDCDTRSVRNLSPTPAAEIELIRFTAEGASLIAVSQEGSLMQWSLPSGTLRHRPFRTSRTLSGFADDGAGELFAAVEKSSRAVGAEGVIHLARTPAVANADVPAIALGRITTGDIAHHHPLDIDAASGLIAVGTRAGALSVWRAPRSAQRAAPAPPLIATTLEFDGKHLVAASDRMVWLADAGDGRAAWPAIKLPHPVGFAALSIAGDMLVVTAGRTLHRFRAADGTALGTPIELSNTPQRVVLTRDGRHAVASWSEYRDGHLRDVLAAFDLHAGRATGATVSLPGPLLGITVDSEGKRLLAWRGAAISVFELTTMRLAFPPIDLAGFAAATPGQANPVPVLPGSAINMFDVLAGGDRLVANRFISPPEDLDQATLCRASLIDGAVEGCTRMPFDWIGIAGDARLDTVATSTGQLLRRDGSLQGYGAGEMKWPAAITISADGERLARVVEGGIELIDVPSNERVAPLLPVPLGPIDVLAQLAFSPDGERLAGRTVAGRWLVWDVPAERRMTDALQAELTLLTRAETRAPLADGIATMLKGNDAGAPRQEPAPPRDAARWIAGLPVSPRSPLAPASTLDLTGSYNAALPAQNFHTAFGAANLSLRADGLQRLLGVDYDARGSITLAAHDAVSKDELASITLALPRPDVAALHLLVAAFTIRQDIQTKPYLHATLIYRDGSRAEQDFLFLRDLTPAWGDDRDSLGKVVPPDPLGKAGPPWIAWRNYPSHHYDYLAAPSTLQALRMENPHPGRDVASVVFAAIETNWPSPSILAVTVEPVASRTQAPP